MPPKLNLVGQHFGRLAVLEEAGHLRGRVGWRCVCTCGKEIVTTTDALGSGNTKSCGCLQRDRAIQTNQSRARHGMSKSSEFKTWDAMIYRCTKPTAKYWSHYGGRGITVCEHWLKFENFFADMGKRPEGTWLEKDNGPGQYWCPRCGGDVRWATPREQAQTRRPATLTETARQRIRAASVRANQTRHEAAQRRYAAPQP